MKREELRRFNTVKLLNIEADAPYEWGIKDATHIRVCLPVSEKNQLEMQNRGFFHADRMIHTSINLTRSKVDYKKLIRMDIVQTTDYKEEIRQIALKSFPSDRRFHVGIHCDMIIASPIISQWVQEFNECIVCLHHDNPVGFLNLQEIQDRINFVHMAALEERYRASGAAVSLYAYAVEKCKKEGFRSLNGCISTNNMAVMNLYAFLGASFSNPVDIFLKEVL